MHLPDGSPLPLVRIGAFPNETYVLGSLGMGLDKRSMYIIRGLEYGEGVIIDILYGVISCFIM